MKRIGLLLKVALAVVIVQLGWTWLQRHDADLRMRRFLAGRQAPSAPSGPERTGVHIVQFYARSAEMYAGDSNLICYGVENTKALRLEPPVENLTPALVRCFFVEPATDTTYKLTAEGFDGQTETVSFSIKVKPPPPEFRMIEVSDRTIPRGEVLTICYGVEHARAVRLDPIGWQLPASKQNCIRLYPKETLNYTIVALGAAGMEERERFKVAVK